MRLHTHWRVLCLSLLLLGHAGMASVQKHPTQGKRASLIDAVRDADQGWNRVFNAKKMDESVAFCTTDASVMAPNAPIATGRDAIRTLFSGFFALPKLKITWTPSKVD